MTAVFLHKAFLSRQAARVYAFNSCFDPEFVWEGAIREDFGDTENGVLDGIVKYSREMSGQTYITRCDGRSRRRRHDEHRRWLFSVYRCRSR
jgi:hypothetical protein